MKVSTSPATDDLPELPGEHIHLRGFRPSDLDDFYAMHSDPQVMRYWSFPAWTDRTQATDYFASALAGRDAQSMLCWVIAMNETDRLIGAVTLHRIERRQGRADVGYVLQAAHWGRGYAREVLRRVLDHAFGVLELRRIEADIDPRNSASCRLVERLGFVREGILRARWNVAGEICDSAIYGLLIHDRAR